MTDDDVEAARQRAIGLPIWIFDVLATGDFHVFSVFTHVVSPMIGLLAARQWGWNAHILWQTIAVYLLLQILARWLTPAALNINVAFTVYAPVRSIFGNFWVYSAANLIGLFAWAWAAHRLLEKKQR